MRPVDPLVLASYEQPRKWVVMFVDGVEMRVWASNAGQARILGKLKRKAEGRGPAYVSCVAVEQ